ncbi:MAG: redoxin domain-containing protein, partial [Planctomycetes bacterium]|nr:redoxin domain-containing protein [Planctomycetota bacterium]
GPAQEAPPEVERRFRMNRKWLTGMGMLLLAFLLVMSLASSQVLGPCTPAEEKGTTGGETPQVSAAPAAPAGLVVSPVPVPGQPAMDFKLPAVVGDELKEVKLSDSNGKWRVLCFFPAAFTFV